jgi:hypothetical protein
VSRSGGLQADGDAVNDGSASRASASFSPSAATVSGSMRRPHRLMIRLTASTAASGLPLRRYQRGLSGISNIPALGRQNGPSVAGRAR